MEKPREYKLAAGLAVLTVLLLAWISGAVGIIGSEHNAANAMYIGVVVVGVVGAGIARFRSDGMARALFATAIAQAIVTGIAIIQGLGAPGSGAGELLGLNGFFILMWMVAGLLFRRASHSAASSTASAG